MINLMTLLYTSPTTCHKSIYILTSMLQEPISNYIVKIDLPVIIIQFRGYWKSKFIN